MRVKAVGVIGAGTMGTPLAEHLLKAGHEVRVHDVNDAAVQGLCAKGARRAASARDAARDSDVTLVVVVDDEQVRQIGRAHV